MSEHLSAFLIDTLLWTGALIALVLMLRRLVAQCCGAQAAYALWALPMLRLILPPVTLPAWLRPTDPAQGGAVTIVDNGGATQTAAVMTPPVDAAFTLSDLMAPLLLLWLAGAGVFLLNRFALYHRMRRELLDGARPVGEAGVVRLVESPAITGPVAFGLRDKVVALPFGFMASVDRQARDLALAHELAHHRGHDLLVNVLVQPLFALHWFNPLGWAGWRALRRDQEAACDARVVAHCNVHQRAAYANLIADFARLTGTAPRAALAAPMACPVLGDKSIIQRLRNLTMAEISQSRRNAARLGLVGAVLALPLTASITYAEEAQDAPTAEQEMVMATDAATQAEADAADAQRDADEAERDAAQALRDAELAAADAEAAAAEGSRVIARRIEEPGRPARYESRIVRHGRGPLTDDELARMHADAERDLANARRELEQHGKAHREIRIALSELGDAMPKVVLSCTDRDQPVTSVEKGGKTTLYVCESAGGRMALAAIRDARADIAADTDMPADARAEVLRSLDAEIAKLSK